MHLTNGHEHCIFARSLSTVWPAGPPDRVYIRSAAEDLPKFQDSCPLLIQSFRSGLASQFARGRATNPVMFFMHAPTMRLYRISSTGAEARFLLEDSEEPRLPKLLPEFRNHLVGDLWKQQTTRYNGFIPPSLVDHLLDWVRDHEFFVPLTRPQVQAIEETFALERVELEI